MSTKPIREALERIQCTCRDHSCVGCKAEAAVSAIERAAKTVLRDKADEFVPTKDIDAAYSLMASIVEDAP